jgi:signal transduction histidine kinase
MSHEIRTPINAIIGFSDLLVNEEYSEEEKKEFGNLIKNSGTTLLKLIDDIIDISILESGHLKLKKSSFAISSLEYPSFSAPDLFVK